MSGASPRVILGTMTIGNQVDAPAASELVGSFLGAGRTEIDTAYGYSEGATERILGTVLGASARGAYAIATKANPTSKGSLSAEAVTAQLTESLERLRIPSVDLFYLHQPDPKTPVQVTLAACDRLGRQGKFRELGLSNYASWQVAHIVHLCKEEGWIRPTVYQGMYNGVTRDVERELFPCLRELGLRFYAYNPMAGGLLSGRYRGGGNKPQEGRFAVYGFYADRYWKSSYLGAAEKIAAACDREGIPPAHAALRWMMHHSALDGSHGDGAILGASRPAQLKENLAACAEGPLPGSVVDAFSAAWEMARPDCPKYFRP